MIKIMQVIIWVINMIMVKIHKITSIEERLLSFPQLPPVCNVLLLLNEKEQDPIFLQKDSLDFLEACLDPTKNILHEGHLSLSLSLSARGSNTALKLLHKISILP